jgi:hypothetical protein
MARTLGMRAPISQAMEEQWFERAVADYGKTGYHFVAASSRTTGRSGRSACSTWT